MLSGCLKSAEMGDPEQIALCSVFSKIIYKEEEFFPRITLSICSRTTKRTMEISSSISPSFSLPNFFLFKMTFCLFCLTTSSSDTSMTDVNKKSEWNKYNELLMRLHNSEKMYGRLCVHVDIIPSCISSSKKITNDFVGCWMVVARGSSLVWSFFDNTLMLS